MNQINRKKKGSRSTVLLLIVFFVGLCVLLYPTVSNWWNHRVTSQIVSTYDEAVDTMAEEDYSAWFEAAEAYNESLNAVGSATAISNPDLVAEDYWDTLDITGTGVMGYITIDKIDVQLPIYHGMDVNVLQVGAGHLEGTSLPVGGEGTHAVICAHRGLPSALLFTDLDQLEVGDTFTITVLNRVLTYEVDQISIVEPDELNALCIQEGKDYCTLMTCTPYGINTHRLLVRGVRTAATEEPVLRVTAEAYKIETLTVASVLAALILVVLLIWLLLSARRKRRK